MAIQAQPVTITQTTTITGETNDTIVLRVQGLYYPLKTGFVLRFEEKQEEGSIQTTFKYTNGRLALLRDGIVRMNHSFIEGQVTQSMYRHPLMAMQMATETSRLEVGEDRFRFVYGLFMNGEWTGQYDVDVTWTTEEEER